MGNKNDQKFIAQQIRAQYTEKQYTQLDALKKLDKKVKKPANVFAYVFGCIAAVVMGSGMSLVMTDIGETIGVASPMAPGIVIGIIGMLMAIINYPIYKKLLASRRNKYSAEIMKLSDDILNK